VVALLVTQGALAASPVPAFPRDGTVVVQDVPDSFGKLRRFLAQYRSPVGVKYHVAVVAFTDPHNREGQGFGDESGEYLRRLVEKWRVSADPENSVIILLGLRNRDVRIHPFSRWSQLGWKDYEVVKTLEASRFSSFASASDYDSALRALVVAIDAELTRRGREMENQEQRARELISEARNKLWVIEALASPPQYEPDEVRRGRERAVAGVEQAQRALDAGAPRQAFELAKAAAGEAEQAERLLTELRQVEASSREKLAELRTRAAALERALEEGPRNDAQAGDALKETTTALQAAERLLESHDDPRKVARQVEAAASSLWKAEGHLTALRQLEAFSHERLAELRVRAAALERALEQEPHDGQARDAVKAATTELQAADRLQEARDDPRKAARQVEAAAASLGTAEGHLAKLRWTREEKARARKVLLGLGLAAAGMWLVVQRLRSAGSGRVARELIQEWETLLQRLADDLVKFEDEHALLLGQTELRQRFEEKSAGPLLEMVRAVDNLYLSFEAAQRVLADARQELERAGPLRWLRVLPYERAIERLTVREFLVRSEDSSSRKPYLPPQGEVKVKPQQLLAQIRAAWERAVSLVDRVEERSRAAWEQLDQRKQELGELESLELRLEELGLPTPLRDETAELASKLQAVRERVKEDPQEAAKEAERLAPRLSELRKEAEHQLQIASSLGKDVREAQAEARAAVERLRADGFTVEEPGFEPGAMLTHIQKTSAEALSAVRAQRYEVAEEKASEALGSAVELMDLCERIRRSREQSARRLDAAMRRNEDLHARRLERSERLRVLCLAHADSALQPALDNVAEASPVLHQAARCLAEARACMAPEAQRYLAAEELIDRATQRLDAVDALFQEIETKAEDLSRARQDAEDALLAAARSYEQLQGVMKDRDLAPTRLREAYEEATRELSDLKRAAEAKRPDWPALRARATALVPRLATTLKRALTEMDASELGRKLQKELLAQRDSSFKELISGPAREPVHVLLQRASQELDDTVVLAKRADVSWPALLDTLRRVQKAFESASQFAKTKRGQRETAREALAAADQALRAADTGYGAGVTADLSAARRCLAKALERHAKHEYLAVMHAADEVHQEVRKAVLAAQTEVGRRDGQRHGVMQGRYLPDAWTATFSDDDSSPGRPSLGSSSGRSGFGKAGSRRKKR